jgi:glutathione peroxidase-family protein
MRADVLDKQQQTILAVFSFPCRHLAMQHSKLAEDLADRSTEQYSHIVASFCALAVCHSVLADKPEPQERFYHLESHRSPGFSCNLLKQDMEVLILSAESPVVLRMSGSAYASTLEFR